MLTKRFFMRGAAALVLLPVMAAAGFQNILRLTPSGVMPAPVVPSGSPVVSISGLIVPPGYVTYNGVVYDIRAEGLYDIFNAGNLGLYDGGYRIVYQSDVLALMQGVAWMTVYGRSDEALSSAQLINLMRSRYVAARCDVTIERIAKPICTQAGLQSRVVRLLTAEAPNNQDDGHVAIEVLGGGKWQLFDVATDAVFRDPVSGVILSIRDVITSGIADVTTEALAPSMDAPTDWSSTQLATSAYYDAVLRGRYPEWRQRIYQIPGIDHTDGLTYFYLPAGAESRQSWVLGLSPNYRIIDEATWATMFYS